MEESEDTNRGASKEILESDDNNGGTSKDTLFTKFTRSFSRNDNESQEEDDDFFIKDIDIHNVQTMHQRIRMLKYTVLAVIVVVSCLLLVISVAYDVTHQYEDFNCEEEDLECLELLCPPAWQWDGSQERCELRRGYMCCVGPGVGIPEAPIHQIHCFNSSQGRPAECRGRQVHGIPSAPIHALGVAPSTYKLSCRPGFVWVSWREKCIRKS